MSSIEGEFAISDTRPARVVSGSASTFTSALCPSETVETSVSSTSASTFMRARSATVRMTVPGLFIVPITAISPRSMLSWVIVPSIGASKRVFRRLSSDIWTAASSRSASSRFESTRALSELRCVLA